MKPTYHGVTGAAAIVLALFVMVPDGTAQGWTRLPNTALRASTKNSVCPPNGFQPPGGGMYMPNGAYPFLDNCHTVITAWNGAAADTKRNRLIIIGGGHAAYDGNEVYSLDLTTLSRTTATSCIQSPAGCRTNTSAPTLTRLNDPSIFSSDPKAPDRACPQTFTTLPGDTPLSQHSYGALVYLPKADAVPVWDGGTNPCGGAYGNLFFFRLDTQTWEHRYYTTDPANSGSTRPVGDTGGVFWDLDPTTTNESLVGWVNNHDLVRYDVVQNKFYRLVPWGTYTIQLAPAVVADPDRKLLFAIGNDGSGTPGSGRMFVTDLTDTARYTTTNWTSTLTGCSDLLDFGYPGVTWDPSLHKIVGYVTKAANTTVPSNRIIIFDPATRSCTVHPMSEGGPIAADDFLVRNRGMKGRFNYFPALGKYLVVNNYAGDAYTFSLNATPTHGLGASTLNCVDRDGDGYGTGPGCTGPDADDQDSGVSSGAQALSKWGTMTAYVRHLGYNPTNIWYIAPGGNDSTGAVNNSSLPFATCCGTGKANPAGGDMLMFRGGDYNTYINVAGRGAQGSPILLLAYPGELPSFTTLGTSGISCTSYMVLDGFKLVRTEGNTNMNCANVNHAQFKHVDSSGNKWGIVASNSTGVAMTDMTIEDSVFRDNWNLGCGTSEHGIYITNHQDQAARQASILDRDIFVRRNLLYQNCRNGIQVNGRFTNVVVEQNVSYSNDGNSGFAFLTGVQRSAVRNNVTFNNSSVGITVFGYPDFCAAYDPQGPCPYDQNYNLFENNTIYMTGFDPKDGTAVGSQAAFSIVNSSSTPVDLGHNTFRNNILVTYSVEGAGGYGYPHFRYDEAGAPSTSIYDHNLFFSTQGKPGTYTNVIQTKSGGVKQYYTCEQAMAASGAAFGSFTGCNNADPMFIAANPSFWNNPALFDLRLQSGSPAVGAGVAASSGFDLVGNLLGLSPSVGAYAGPPAGPCDLDGNGAVDASDVQTAISQALRFTSCTTGDLLQDGNCNVVDVQRVVNAALGGACVVGK